MKQLRGIALLTGGTLCFGTFAGCTDYDGFESEGPRSKVQNLAEYENLTKGQIVDAPLGENSLIRKYNLPTGTWKVWGQIPLAESWEKAPEVTANEEEGDEPDQGDHVSSR